MGLSKKIRYLSHRTWVIEAIAMIASVGCLSGIVAILATMHNCRLSDWGAPFSVTATVSALITASKSTLLLVVASCISQRKWRYFRKPRPLLDFDTFDGASRGPLGALELLLGKAAHAKTAALGALITTIVLAWDPSAQLLIEFETRSVANYDPRATFGYSSFYDSGLRIESDVERTMDEDKEMLAAIINGLYGRIPETLFSCPTDKCDWTDEYTTLGFDSKCMNVTAQSNRFCGEGMSPGALYCNITTPGGVVLKTKDQQGFQRTGLNVSSVCLGDRIAMQFEDGRCDPKMLNTSTVATFAVYRHSTVYPFDQDSPAPPWEVIECNISLAALTHTGISVRNNSFHIRDTRVTRLIPDQVPSEYWIYGESTQEYLNFSMYDPASEGMYPSGSPITFKINDADWYFLVRMLYMKVFQGGISENYLKLYARDNMGFDPSTFRYANITVLSANIASAMTNYVQGLRNRTTPDDSVYTDATGYSYSDEIFVNVRWGWFVVHIATVVATVVLVVITYVTHMREGRPAWKNSNVVLLLHWISGMDAEDWRAIEACETVEDYEKAVDSYVEDVWVRTSDDETLCLEKVDPHAAEEGISLITQVESTAPKVSE